MKGSLHLKDANGGNFNHAMWYQFSPSELKSMYGKTMRVSAWIKQVFASNPPFVGISLHVVLALSVLVARETRHYVYDGNIDEESGEDTPTVMSK